MFFKNKPIKNINNFEKRVYSQNGEDGIIATIFDKISTTNKYFVEFGVEDGRECNTRNLRENFGWNGLMMDGNGYNNPLIKKEFITNDPGTRKGELYRYNETVLYSAIRDYPTGYHETINKIEKNMIVVNL